MARFLKLPGMRKPTRADKIATRMTFSLICLNMICASAFGADIEHIVGRNGEDLIIILGEIKQGDDQKFNNVASSLKSATVLLSSPGGSVEPSLEIGKSLRLRGYSTLVMNGENCQSACALIWLAGSPRRLSKSAKVGFHSVYLLAGSKPVVSGVGNAIVGRYLTLLNLPEPAVIFATVSPPNGVNWLTPSNYRGVGIDLTVETDYGKSDDNGKSNAPAMQRSNRIDRGDSNSETYKWDSVGSWGVHVDTTLGNSCFIISEFEKGTVLRVGFENNSNTDGMIILGGETWSSLVEGEEYKLTAKFGLFAAWSLPTTAVKLGGARVFLKGAFSDERFWSELGQAPDVKFSYKGKSIATLDLKDSSKAILRMIDCQKEQRAKVGADPFSN